MTMATTAAVTRQARRVGIASVAVVASVAAVVSYNHMLQVCLANGQGWMSYLEPLSVDGLIVGASLVLSVRRASKPAWAAVIVGLLVSLAANLDAADPSVVAHVVSAWPAVALALSYETLLTLVRKPQPARKPARRATAKPAARKIKSVA